MEVIEDVYYGVLFIITFRIMIIITTFNMMMIIVIVVQLLNDNKFELFD
jgi:hypothetical protein